MLKTLWLCHCRNFLEFPEITRKTQWKTLRRCDETSCAVISHSFHLILLWHLRSWDFINVFHMRWSEKRHLLSNEGGSLILGSFLPPENQHRSSCLQMLLPPGRWVFVLPKRPRSVLEPLHCCCCCCWWQRYKKESGFSRRFPLAWRMCSLPCSIRFLLSRNSTMLSKWGESIGFSLNHFNLAARRLTSGHTHRSPWHGASLVIFSAAGEF